MAEGERYSRNSFLNIVKRKTECSGFPASCISDESKENYVVDLKEKCFINLQVSDIKKNPAGRYLNKIMANSVWGKWAQNPSSQSSLSMCETIREHHEKLLSGRVKEFPWYRRI